jgi:hypothetical protein
MGVTFDGVALRRSMKCGFCGYAFPDSLGKYGCPNCEGSRLGRLNPGGFGLGVLGPLAAGIGAELRQLDSAEPLATGRLGAVVPVRFPEGIECSTNFALVHAALYTASVPVSNTVLDTVTHLCYNGFVGSKKEIRNDGVPGTSKARPKSRERIQGFGRGMDRPQGRLCRSEGRPLAANAHDPRMDCRGRQGAIQGCWAVRLRIVQEGSPKVIPPHD